LPSKAIYPDYYVAIEKPISLKQIQEKVERKQYGSLEAFGEDMDRMFDNAMIYNMEGSLIYSNATWLKDMVRRKLKGDEVEAEAESPAKKAKVTIKIPK
jgi:ATP-dependent helicase STH1/SNF2